MAKFKYKDGAEWKSVAPSQQEFDDLKQEVNQGKLDYVQHIESELGEEHIIRSLPNGTKDEISIGQDGKYYHRKNVGDEVDLNPNLNITTLVDLNNVRTVYTNTASSFPNASTFVPGSVVVSGMSEVSSNDADKVESIGKYYVSGLRIRFIYPLDTPLSTIREQLTGKTLTYQLAEPILMPLPKQMTPNTIEIARLSELTNKLTNAIISLGGTIV